MSIAIDSRTAAEVVLGALVYWVPDGAQYGNGDTQQVADKNNVPTFEEAVALGRCLGMISGWKWNTEYKTITKNGVDPETQRYTETDRRILTKVKPQFTTQDVTPEAYALEHGMTEIPKVGETAQPFSNASGSLRGHLYVALLDSLRTTGEDGELAQIYLRGDLSLQDATENNNDLKQVNYEFTVTKIPADGFKNLGIAAAL